MPGSWSEQEDHQQTEDTETSEGGGCLQPHLCLDDVSALKQDSKEKLREFWPDLEEEEDGQVAHDAAALIQAPEYSRVTPRCGDRGVNREKLTLVTQSLMPRHQIYVRREKSGNKSFRSPVELTSSSVSCIPDLSTAKRPPVH